MSDSASTVRTKRSVGQLLSAPQFRELVDAELANTYAELLPNAAGVDATFAELINEMSIFIARGGKRMRPYLCYLGYAGHGGLEIDEIAKVATSQELYHNAWMIHDDIIDRDTRRYNGLNLAGTYTRKFADKGAEEPHHFADAVALIAGDVNLTLASQAILTSKFPVELKVAALSLQQRLNVDLAGGELLDVLLPVIDCHDLTEARLLALSQYKTATYSFQAPLQIGAILAGASNKAVESLERYAISAGIAFQLSDDVLGIYGEDEKTGKSNLSDIREGKRTLLVLEAFSRGTDEEIASLVSILGKRTADAADLEVIRQIMKRTGGFDLLRDKIDWYIQDAKKALECCELSHEAQLILSGLVDGLREREV